MVNFRELDFFSSHWNSSLEERTSWRHFEAVRVKHSTLPFTAATCNTCWVQIHQEVPGRLTSCLIGRGQMSGIFSETGIWGCDIIKGCVEGMCGSFVCISAKTCMRDPSVVWVTMCHGLRRCFYHIRHADSGLLKVLIQETPLRQWCWLKSVSKVCFEMISLWFCNRRTSGA